ncbi:MAG: hypothetical protein J3R72DRAFT_487180 [Linnemannia gamsii]|nr:MAG: hypothetical protein J3R72DRAFT_487180 [Linnemannia gamsii]
MSMATTPKHKPKLSYKAQSFPSSDKPFECTACQLYFRRLHDLKRHERLHTGERPYCCNNQCGRTFARLDALKRHLSAESNVHCSEWTYQPGLAMGMSRGAGKSHQRSLSLPHVHGSTSRVDLGDLEDSVEQRTPTTPSPQDHLLLPFRHFHHNHPQPHLQQQHTQHQHQQQQPSSSSPASSAAAAGFGSGPFTPPKDRADIDGDTFMTRRASPILSSPDHHRWRKELLPWAGVHKRSFTQPSVGKLLPSDMIMDDSPVFDRSSTGLLSSPMAHPHPHHPLSRPHMLNNNNNININNEPHPHPHPQYSLAAFKRVQPRPRRDSHPSLSSRSTLSPSLSPALSPSPSSISPSSMSSPTNVWSYSKGFEYNDITTTGATTPTNNNNAIPDRRAPQQEARAAHARSESSTFPSFRSSSSSSSSSYRHDRPAPLNEDNHHYPPHPHQQQQQQQQQQQYQQQQPREMERHPATSLATILNDQPGPTADRHTPPHPPPAASSHSQQQRPAYFSHRGHSQSLSHIHPYSTPHHHQQSQYHQQQYLQHHHHHYQQSVHPLSSASSSSSFPHEHQHNHGHHHHHEHHHEHDSIEGAQCCDAKAEIQKLRQELDWYRSHDKNEGTATTTTTTTSSSSCSNSDIQFNGARMITSP